MDPADAPLTELIVALTIAAESHQDDVAVVMEKLQAAMKEAQAATGNRIKLTMALPDIVRTELVRSA
ncbi:MAG: hypothetical protein C0467_32130 [Planctomycetaceae bacterium]|nr:hypothetical protein [Planctomycetaceae bacterium]